MKSVQSAAEASEEFALIARIAGGDEGALQVLCSSYRLRLWSYLWRQLDGNTGLAEEALQDTFLAVWRGAARFRGDAPVPIWIFRIAHHVAAKARRDLGRHAEGHLVALGDDEDASTQQRFSSSPETEVLDRLTLHGALDRLSVKHREVIDLVCDHGFAIDEVAHILDIPAGTVRSRLSYARQALHRELTLATSDEAPDHER